MSGQRESQTTTSSDLNLAALLGGVALCLLALLMVVYSVRLWQAARAGDTRIGGDFAAFYAAARSIEAAAILMTE